MFNEGNTGFMLLAAALVMLMTPGLAFFYGGLVGRSNTLTIMIQSFASMGITTAMWWLVGYSLCFNGGQDGIYGNFHFAFLRHVNVHTLYAPSGPTSSNQEGDRCSTRPTRVSCSWRRASSC